MLLLLFDMCHDIDLHFFLTNVRRQRGLHNPSEEKTEKNQQSDKR